MLLVLLSLMTGMLGLYLNYRVLKEVDWSSPAYSTQTLSICIS